VTDDTTNLRKNLILKHTVKFYYFRYLFHVKNKHKFIPVNFYTCDTAAKRTTNENSNLQFIS